MNKSNNRRTIDEALNTVSNLQTLSMDFWTKAFHTGRKLSEEWMHAVASPGTASKGQWRHRSVPCCPPDQECPPHCLAEITREAHPGEVIIVPFAVKNCCGGPKTYKVGIRPLKNQDGQEVLPTPSLDKDQVTLDPNQSIQVRMKVSLGADFQPGQTYKTEIVLREQDVNQNICFTLKVSDAAHGPEICPLEESAYFNRFQSWDSHFYCEQPRANVVTPNTANIKSKK